LSVVIRVATINFNIVCAIVRQARYFGYWI
jgi:hypothetical protein